MKISQLVPTPKGVFLAVARLIHLTGHNRIFRLLIGRKKTDSNEKKSISTAITIVVEGEKLAQCVLGDDCLLPEDICRIYGVSYSEKQRTALAMTVPGFMTLLWLRISGSMLVATLPTDCNLSQFHNLINQPFCRRGEIWRLSPLQRFFRKDVVKACQWLAVRKRPYLGSMHKTWAFQQYFLTEEDYIPNAVEVTYAFTSFHKVRGVCLLYGVYVRTSSISKDGRHIIVGDNRADGMNVCEFRDDEAGNCVGVLSARIAA